MEEWVVLLLTSGMALIGLLTVGMPIGFALALLGFTGTWYKLGLAGALGALSLMPYSSVLSFLLAAIPLFILMAEIMVRSGISADLYTAMNKWLGRLPGGLAISSIGACAIFAAVCGSSIATAATIGIVAIPEMQQRGYNDKLSSGSVAAAGALGTLIPPSMFFLLYGAFTEQSIASLFIGGIIPGAILAFLMGGYVVVLVRRRPSLAPSIPAVPWRERISSLIKIWPVISIIALILGVIYTGTTTVTEAAAIGACFALLVVLFQRRFSLASMRESIIMTALTTSSVLIIFVGAMIFSYFLTISQIPQELTFFVASLNVPPLVIIVLINIMLLVLGTILDVGGIIMLTTPILFPIITGLNFDPIWFGVVMAVNLEMAVITPPVGLNLYIIKGIMPDISLSDIIRGAMPFLIVEAIVLALTIAFPQLSLFLPGLMK